MSTPYARCRDHDLATDESGRCVLCRRDARAAAPAPERAGEPLPVLPIVLASSFGLLFVGGLVLAAFVLAGTDGAMAADETGDEPAAAIEGAPAPGNASAPPPTPTRGQGAASQSPRAATGGDKVDVPIEVYSASWCPACRAAKRWLDQNGYEYVDYDIDRDAAARTRLRTLNPRGSIPVIVVDRDRTFVGFDPNALESAIDAAARH